MMTMRMNRRTALLTMMDALAQPNEVFLHSSLRRTSLVPFLQLDTESKMDKDMNRDCYCAERWLNVSMNGQPRLKSA